MAYLTVIASVAEAEVIRFREGLIETMAASKVERVSHYLAYSVRKQPLGKLLGEAIDGGELLSQDLWHPFRAPVVQNPQTVKNCWYQITEAWKAVTGEVEVAADDWYRIEISKLIEILAHASRHSECIVSLLEPPADFEIAKRVRMPIAAVEGDNMEPGVAIPILPARDLHETRAFYERLGFQAAGWWPTEFGGYAILVRGDLSMHFFSFADISPDQNYAQCYWRVKDVDALYAEFRGIGLSRSGIPRLDPVANRPWGMREFSIVDPNGNLVRIGRQITSET